MKRRFINLKASPELMAALEAVATCNRLRGAGPASKQALVTAYIERALAEEFPPARQLLERLQAN